VDYKVLKKDSPGYPKRLKERLGSEAPAELYYHGPLGHLKHFTMAVISADSISGLAMMAANQVLFTVREYAMNYIGGWHSVMETEIFRLGLFRKNVRVTLFSAKGLGKETFESFLNDRFCPPLHEFPERDEYDRRAKEGELLILSLTQPSQGRTLKKNVLARNWVACALADVVFVPFATRGTKTLAIAKRVVEAGIPIFTTDEAENSALHTLGITGLDRKTVGDYLEKLGAIKADSQPQAPQGTVVQEPVLKYPSKSQSPEQIPLWKRKQSS
jgi:predicted Rossmann fold nucleotide-binding protein DprA/Smf involved in DNA uptake